MAAEIVSTGQLNEKDFLALISTCHSLNMFSDALVLVESLPDHVIKVRDRQGLLLFERFSFEIPFAKYTSGRIFTDQLELRWARQEQNMRVVYCGRSEYASVLSDYHLKSGEDRLLPDKLEKRPRGYVLFGERLRPEDVEKIAWAQPGDFAEARIPRLLRYPPPNYKGKDSQRPPKNSENEQEEPRYLQLQVCEYIDKTGNVVLSRFQCLKAAEDYKHEPI